MKRVIYENLKVLKSFVLSDCYSSYYTNNFKELDIIRDFIFFWVLAKSYSRSVRGKNAGRELDTISFSQASYQYFFRGYFEDIILSDIKKLEPFILQKVNHSLWYRTSHTNTVESLGRIYKKWKLFFQHILRKFK